MRQSLNILLTLVLGLTVLNTVEPSSTYDSLFGSSNMMEEVAPTQYTNVNIVKYDDPGNILENIGKPVVFVNEGAQGMLDSLYRSFLIPEELFQLSGVYILFNVVLLLYILLLSVSQGQNFYALGLFLFQGMLVSQGTYSSNLWNWIVRVGKLEWMFITIASFTINYSHTLKSGFEKWAIMIFILQFYGLTYSYASKEVRIELSYIGRLKHLSTWASIFTSIVLLVSSQNHLRILKTVLDIEEEKPKKDPKTSDKSGQPKDTLKSGKSDKTKDEPKEPTRSQLTGDIGPPSPKLSRSPSKDSTDKDIAKKEEEEVIKPLDADDDDKEVKSVADGVKRTKESTGASSMAVSKSKLWVPARKKEKKLSRIIYDYTYYEPSQEYFAVYRNVARVIQATITFIYIFFPGFILSATTTNSVLLNELYSFNNGIIFDWLSWPVFYGLVIILPLEGLAIREAYYNYTKAHKPPVKKTIRTVFKMGGLSIVFLAMSLQEALLFYLSWLPIRRFQEALLEHRKVYTCYSLDKILYHFNRGLWILIKGTPTPGILESGDSKSKSKSKSESEAEAESKSKKAKMNKRAKPTKVSKTDGSLESAKSDSVDSSLAFKSMKLSAPSTPERSKDAPSTPERSKDAPSTTERSKDAPPPLKSSKKSVSKSKSDSISKTSNSIKSTNPKIALMLEQEKYICWFFYLTWMICYIVIQYCLGYFGNSQWAIGISHLPNMVRSIWS